MEARRLLAATALCLGLTGCITTYAQRIPPKSQDREFDITANRSQVFERALSTAISLNLSVDVMDKTSGFIQFKNASLSADQLDQFAEFPFGTPDGKPAVGGFTNWNRNSSTMGGGMVTGSVSLSLMATETAGGSHVKMHTNIVASNRTETHQANSKGFLEAKFENALKEVK